MNFGNMGQMMKQVQKMQKQIQQLQEELEERTVEATAGGGVVRVVVNGRQEVVSVELEPEVVDPDDVEMLQDLVIAATNEALRNAQDMVNKEMAKITGGLNIPGLPGLPGN